MIGQDWETAVVYHNQAYLPMKTDSMTIYCDCRPSIMTSLSCSVSYFVVIKSISNVAHHRTRPIYYSAVRFGSMASVNHSSCFARLDVAYHMLRQNRTLSRDFGMGCSNGLECSVGDHTGKFRRTFVAKTPEKTKQTERE